MAEEIESPGDVETPGEVEKGAEEPGPSVSLHLKNVVMQMTTANENSSAVFQYNYAEYLGDGRGITFGIVGFTTGTYDGNMLIKYYTRLQKKISGVHL